MGLVGTVDIGSSVVADYRYRLLWVAGSDRYWFAIRAANENGWGELSNVEVMTAMHTTVPDRPRQLTPSQNGISTFELRWLPPIFDGGQTLLVFHIEVSAGNEESWTLVSSVDERTARIDEPTALFGDGVSYSCCVDALTRGCSYKFRVNAQNGKGEGAWSEPSMPLLVTPSDRP